VHGSHRVGSAAVALEHVSWPVCSSSEPSQANWPLPAGSSQQPKQSQPLGVAGPQNDMQKADCPDWRSAQVAIVPEGYELKAFAAEPDIINPVSFALDDRARVWAVEGMTYPNRAKEGQGKDRVLVFEDTDGDGKHDKRTVFMEGLNLVSGIEVGNGGVYIGAAPYVHFVPVKDWNEPKPAGPMETLLDGRSRVVRFTADPFPLLRALAEGRLPDVVARVGEYEIEITPEGAAAMSDPEGRPEEPTQLEREHVTA
jgi:hypothetical protein